MKYGKWLIVYNSSTDYWTVNNADYTHIMPYAVATLDGEEFTTIDMVTAWIDENLA